MKCCHFTQRLSTDEVQRHTKYVTESDELFTADVLFLKSIKLSSELKCQYKPEQLRYSVVNTTELDTSDIDLVELLQQSAFEHLTTFRQLEAQEFGSVAAIVTTDFEALYAYKHGNYQRCLQLSAQNVGLRTLLYVVHMTDVWTYPEFLQLMDDDTVSMIALTLIVNPECRDHFDNVGVYQLTLSLYLMTQCQLKLHHSVTSLAQTLTYIEVTQRQCSANNPLDHLILKLTERKVMIYLSYVMRC